MQEKLKILFVCHGNICRSPMAHCVLTKMVKEQGREKEFYIDSMATSTEELGNGIYPPAKKKLFEKGIPLVPHYSVQLKSEDYDRFHLIIGMDSANIRNILRICGKDPEGKVFRLLDLTERGGRDVADPWYTGDFEATYRDVLEGCTALLEQIDEGKLPKNR